jgi:hypothetical protein
MTRKQRIYLYYILVGLFLMDASSNKVADINLWLWIPAALIVIIFGFLFSLKDEQEKR